jgi:predicted transcriptional regulator
MTEVTKGELAVHLGVSGAMVSKYVRTGILDKCYTQNGKKLYLEKSIQAIESSRKDFKKEQNHSPQNSIDPNIYNTENIEELDALLINIENPSQRVQVMKDYWTSRINRQKFLKEEGEIIYINEAKAAVEEIFNPLNKFLDDLPIQLKSHNQDVPLEAVKWLSDEINRMKKFISGYQWNI